jgi:hypothetical protein
MNTLNGILKDALKSLDTGFDTLWSVVSPIVPDIVLALIVLAGGLAVAKIVSDKIGDILKWAKIGNFLDVAILVPLSKHTGIKVGAASLISEAIRWFLVAVVLIAALDLANMTRVINFFNQVLAYLPNILTAVLIVIVGSILANFVAKVVNLITKRDNLTATSKVAVNILAFISALGQLVTPLVASFSTFIGQLSLTSLQADILFIGVLLFVLLASKSTVTKAVESLYKTQN